LPRCFGKGSLLRRILREAALVFVLALLAQISQFVVSLPVDLLEPEVVFGLFGLLLKLVRMAMQAGICTLGSIDP